MIRLDPNLQTSQERLALVQQIIDTTPADKLSSNYLDILSTYLTYPTNKKERLQNYITTQNRKQYINKRDISFEGLVSKFENGEDGIYGLIANDKNIIFMPKNDITPEEVAAIPPLQELDQEIEKVIAILEAAPAGSQKKHLLLKQLIEMRKDRYAIRAAYKKPITMMNVTKSMHSIELFQQIDMPSIDAIPAAASNSICSFMRPADVSAFLRNYSTIKEDAYGRFESDSYYACMDLEHLVDAALAEKHPVLYQVVILKIDGLTNEQIKAELKQQFDIDRTVEYLSSLWRNKIPKLIAEQAQKEYIYWYYTNEVYGKWKRCSRCHEVKPAHTLFFSKNGTSKDGWYSICKECRNAGGAESKIKPRSRAVTVQQ